MLISPKGKSIYAVYTADGCECKFLAGLFSTEALAREWSERLKQDDPENIYGKPELMTVELLPIDQWLDCMEDYKVIQ